MIYDHRNINLARNLRKNMTPWERKLWYCFLKGYPVKFNRQKAIGSYIVDFYCPKAKLAVELDGSGHYQEESQKKDRVRTEELESMGLTVIRFSNLDVDKNFYGVCSVIDEMIKKMIPQYINCKEQ